MTNFLALVFYFFFTVKDTQHLLHHLSSAYSHNHNHHLRFYMDNYFIIYEEIQIPLLQTQSGIAMLSYYCRQKCIGHGTKHDSSVFLSLGLRHLAELVPILAPNELDSSSDNFEAFLWPRGVVQGSWTFNTYPAQNLTHF